MVRSSATTVSDYLAELTGDRRSHVERVYRLVHDNLPPGYDESIQWGMVGWSVPLDAYPDTYNKQPLMLAALASQKNYISLYLNTVYAMPELKALLDGSGKKLRMGKSCINFRTADELPLDVVGEIIRRSDRATYIATVKAQQQAARGSAK